jgi:hypothetical protein
LGESTNLHQVWDSGLIRRKGVAVADYAARLVQRWNAVRDPAGMKAWGVAVDWTAESHRLAQNTILPEGAEIDEAWVDTFLPVMEERLMLAGVRLGGVISQRLR